MYYSGSRWYSPITKLSWTWKIEVTKLKASIVNLVSQLFPVVIVSLATFLLTGCVSIPIKNSPLEWGAAIKPNGRTVQYRIILQRPHEPYVQLISRPGPTGAAWEKHPDRQYICDPYAIFETEIPDDKEVSTFNFHRTNNRKVKSRDEGCENIQKITLSLLEGGESYKLTLHDSNGSLVAQATPGFIDNATYLASRAREDVEADLCKQLINAAYDRNLNKVRRIVEDESIDVNCISEGLGSALWTGLLASGSATSQNTLTMTKYLIRKGANVNYTRNGRDVSNLAGYRGWTETAAYIVENGGDASSAKAGLRDGGINSAVALESLAVGAVAVQKGFETIKESLRSGSNVPSISVQANDVCGVLNQCSVTNLQVSGKNSFEKILDDDNRGVIVADSQSDLAGSYSYAVNLDDVLCGGEFTVKEGVTSVELEITKDGCNLLSVIQN